MVRALPMIGQQREWQPDKDTLGYDGELAVNKAPTSGIVNSTREQKPYNASDFRRLQEAVFFGTEAVRCRTVVNRYDRFPIDSPNS